MGRLTCAGWAALAILAGGLVFWSNVAIAAGAGWGGIEALGLSYGQVRLIAYIEKREGRRE